MPTDPLELAARGAEQHESMSLIALPSGRSVVGPTHDSPHSFVPAEFYDLPRPRTLGRVRMPVRAVFLAVLGVFLAISLFVILHLSGLEEGVGSTWYFAVSLVGAEALLLLLWVWLPRRIMRRHSSAHVLKWRRPLRGDLLWSLAGLAIMAVIWIIFVELAELGDWWWTVRAEPPEDWNAFPNWWVAAGVAFAAVIMAPLVEETFFRGFILGGLNRVWWMIPSILLSAALFSAVHINLYTAIPFALFGLILGALYLRTGHLTAPALAHGGWNLGVTVLLIVKYGVG